MAFSFMDGDSYSRLHALLIVQPFNRLIVTKSQDKNFFWQASLTRTVIGEPAITMLKNTIALVFKVDPNNAFKITTFADVTLDEIHYTILIAEMNTAYKLRMKHNQLVSFIPLMQVLSEILDEVREYSSDSKRVLTYLSNFIKPDRIGNVVLGR